jgi:hypothetical protein
MLRDLAAAIAERPPHRGSRTAAVPPPGCELVDLADIDPSFVIDNRYATTGETAFGAREIDPTKGTRLFHEGEWVYFDKLACRTKFNIAPARYLPPTAQ